MVKLDLGAGENPVAGFQSIDRKNGKEVYPLDVADGSVDEIRASHVLEHFSHMQVSAIVNHWVEKLKPGGLLRIAVPDFELIASRYLKGEAINVQGYVMGGHIDANDYHGTVFDADVLTEIMLNAGLIRLHRWESEQQDCAALPVSLNLGGYKPLLPISECEYTTAVLSAPRFGPIMHFRYALQAFTRANVPYQIGSGAYWHQVLSEIIEAQLLNEATRYIITCDYDTIFTHEDVVELYRLMEAYPHADAVFPLQSKRGSSAALFGIQENGVHKKEMPAYELTRNLLPVTTGHFGLTIFRTDALRAVERPWMDPVPNKEGRWTDGKVDADIQFWHHWKAAGRTLYLAPRVVVGHLQEVITWPDKQLNAVHQMTADYESSGMPSDIRRS